MLKSASYVRFHGSQVPGSRRSVNVRSEIEPALESGTRELGTLRIERYQTTMTRLIPFALVLVALAPAVSAQTSASLTGKWEGTFTMQRPDGTEGEPRPVVFNLTHKGKELTGTAGPADQQWKIEKGTVTAGKATFEVQQPDGPLFKFTLTIVKGRLQGEMTGERDGVVRGRAKVDTAKANKVGDRSASQSRRLQRARRATRASHAHGVSRRSGERGRV
jgi:hypothetical protein